LGPASEYDPRSAAPTFGPTPALSRGFSPPRRYPLIEVHHSRAFACPGHVASLHLPRASTPYSLDELPGVLSTRCVHGTRPSERYLTEIASFLSEPLPLLRLAFRPLQQTLSLLPVHLSRLAVPKTCSSNKPEGLSLSTLVLRRFRRIGISARAASLQGFYPSAGWGSPPPDFSTCGTLALLGFFLLGAFPFRALASRPPPTLASTLRPRTVSRPWLSPTPRPPCARHPLGTSGSTRSGSFSLCFRVSKSSGSWHGLSRGCRPPRFSSSSSPRPAR
jgi:hypothetical protein